MCVPILSPSEPEPTPVISSANTEPKPVNEDFKASREEERRRARIAGGRESTLLTGALGLNNKASVKKKSLLGE